MAPASKSEEPDEVTAAALDLDHALSTVRRALAARYGVDVGADAAAESACWAVSRSELPSDPRNGPTFELARCDRFRFGESGDPDVDGIPDFERSNCLS